MACALPAEWAHQAYDATSPTILAARLTGLPLSGRSPSVLADQAHRPDGQALSIRNSSALVHPCQSGALCGGCTVVFRDLP